MKSNVIQVVECKAGSGRQAGNFFFGINHSIYTFTTFYILTFLN
jgi:hypothetical protein